MPLKRSISSDSRVTELTLGELMAAIMEQIAPLLASSVPPLPRKQEIRRRPLRPALRVTAKEDELEPSDLDRAKARAALSRMGFLPTRRTAK